MGCDFVGSDICLTVCASSEDIDMCLKTTTKTLYQPLCVRELDSPRPGAADHLEDKGRLIKWGEK